MTRSQPPGGQWKSGWNSISVYVRKVKMSFQARKHQILSSLEAQEPDKSPKGYIDAPIIPLCDIINSHPDYVTTSSCSGRIAVYMEGTRTDGESKVAITTKGGRWLFVSHEVVELPTIRSDDWITTKLFGKEASNLTTGQDLNYERERQPLVMFKFEPLVLHVEASDETSATRLTSLAIAAGYRNSGLIPSKSRHVLGIRSSLKLDVPIARFDAVTMRIELLTPTPYLYFLLQMSNEKHQLNKERMQCFQYMLTREFETVGQPIKNGWEDTATRRERKKREGLDKQKTLQSKQDKGPDN